MKILLITHLLPYPPTGGCSLRNFNLIKECSKNNDLYLITFYRKIHLKGDTSLEKAIDKMKEYCKEVHVFEIPSERSKLLWYILLIFNSFTPTPYSAWIYKSSKMIRFVKQFVNNNKIDVIELGEIGLFNYAGLFPDLPKVLVHHNIESQLLFRRSKAEKNILAKLYLFIQAVKLKRFEFRACKDIEYHTTVSANDMNTLKAINPNVKVEVVSNGVDVDYFRPDNIKVEDNSLIFIGGMSWLPNYDAMIYFKDQIWPLLKKEIPDIKITIIGKNPAKDLIDFSHSDKMFQVTGFVDDIRTHMSKAAVYIVPIRIGGGTRLKILDAMSSGKAIVSMSIGCEGIDIKDRFDIYIADKPEDFANDVIELLRDKNKRELLGKNARETATNKYSWGKISPILESVYQKTVVRIR